MADDKSWLNKELAIINRMKEERDAAEAKAVAVGRAFADEIVSQGEVQDKGSPRMYCATVVANLLDRLAKTDEDRECAKLTLEWIAERYWGMQVAEALPVFDKAYEDLSRLNATYSDRLVWGDIDHGAWIEPHESLRIIGLENYCSGDDNTYLFIDESDTLGRKLHCRTCWSRQRRSKYGQHQAESWYSYDRTSIGTYRRFKWKLCYGDLRDKGYVFTYDNVFRTGRVDGAHGHETDIYWALWYLHRLPVGIENPCELPSAALPTPQEDG